MKKPAFLSNERLSRLMTALLLALGLLWPMLWALGVESAFVTATLATAALTALMTFQAAGKKARVICFSLLGALLIGQFFLPGGGFFPSSVEAVKAISLYFNGVTTAPLLFSSQIALLLAVVAAVIGYTFSARGVGYIPATAMVVMVLFGLWSMGKQGFLWYAAPALVALLLLIAQSSHEKSNLFQVLPMAAMLVALGLLIAPGQNVVLGPLHEVAMNLKQTITDYLFFTEPRNVFTLGSYGYYPMGSGKLGGEAEPTEYPVMTVKTSQKTLLRAVTKDEYTGRSWRDTSSGRRYLYVNPRWRSLRQEVFLENMPAETVLKASNLLDQKAISIQMQNSAASTVFTPAYLRSLTTYGSMVPYFNEASELFITRDLISGDRYTVYAPVIEGGDASLGALVNAAPKNDPYYAQIAAKYTALPGHLEERVYQDMRSMIADAATPYEQACAILRHLQRYYRYTLSPVTPPENQDFVTYFLYVGKEGYCTYFASAMTVLCRMAGLPARYVEGFLAQPDSSGFAYVTGQNAHAWTEVYFEGFGWVPFDPTPAQQNVDQQPPQNDPEPEPTPTPSPEPPQDEPDQPTPSPENPEQSNEPDDTDTPDDEPDQKDPPSPWLWLLLLLLAAVAAVCVRIFLRMPDRMAKKQQNVSDQIFLYGSAAYTLMKLTGRTPRKGETPLRFARRMDKQRAFAVPVTPLWRMMALSNYSRLEPTEKLAGQAQDIFNALYKPQGLWVKLRFMLAAGFGKNCYRSLDTELVHQEPESPFGKYKDSLKQAAQAPKKNKQK